MATIEELNFEVILKDSAFESKIQHDIKLANDLNTKLSELAKLNLSSLSTSGFIKQDDVTKAEELATALKSALDSLSKMPNHAKEIKIGFEEANDTLHKSASFINDFERVFGVTLGVAGMRQLVSSMATVTGEFEVQQMALRSMIGDMDKADAIFSDLRQRALESPYTFQDLSKYAKQLAAFNIDADQLVETENRLADVAAGLGVDMGRIILAYGQVKAAGVLKGTELRQFTEAGVPLLQSLADQIKRTEGNAISLSQVFDRISKKQIPFEMVEQAFKDMTSEGGKFYKMQDVLVETLQGKIGKLKDAWQQMLYEVGQSNGGLMKGVLDTLTNLLGNYEALGSILTPIIKSFGAYAGVLAMVAATQKGAMVVENIRGTVKLLSELKNVASFSGKIAALAPSLMSWVGAAAALASVISLVVKAIKKHNEESETYNKLAAECTANISAEQNELKKLANVAVNEAKSMEERQDAIDVINAKYGEYLNKLGIEKASVDNLATSYESLKNAIANKYLEQLKEQTVGEKQSELNDATAELNEFNAKAIRDARVQGRQYNARGIGQIQGEIERFINEHPLFGAEALLGVGEGVDRSNSILGIYDKYGIALGDKQINKLWGLVNGYRDAGEALKRTSKDFEDFAKGYGNAIGLVQETNEKVTEKDDAKWTPTAKGKTQDQKNLEADIKLLQKYKDAYDKLFPYVSTGDKDSDNSLMSKMLSKIFDTDINAGSLEQDILNKADALEKFGEDAKNAADNIRASLGADKLSQTLNQLKALDKYEKTMRQWANEDFNLTGTGVELDMQKVLKDYNDGLAKVNEKVIEATKEAEAAHNGNADAIEEEKKKIDGLAKAEKAALKVTANDKLLDLAKTYAKDKTSGLKMSDWGDKSIGQVKAIWEALEGMMETGVELTPELAVALAEAGLSFDEFADAAMDALGDAATETEEEYFKKLISTAKYCAQQISELAGSFRELGEAMGNDFLVNIGEVAEGVGNMVSSIAEGAATGGWIGAVVAAVVEIGELFAKEATSTAQLKQNIIDAAAEAKKLRYEAQLISGVDSIFGANGVKNVKNAVNVIKEAGNSLSSLMREMSGQKIEEKYRASYGNPIPIEDIIENTLQKTFGFSGNVFKQVDAAWKAAQKATEKGYKGVEAFIIRTQNKNGLLNFFGIQDKYDNLKDIVEGLGYELYDEYNNLNAEALQAVLDTYKGIGNKEREVLEQAIAHAEAYKQAMEQLDALMQNIFGDIASSAADTIIDQWVEAGNAALDYGDILDDVAKKYAKMVVESTILDTVFNDDMVKAVGNAFKDGDYATAMSLVDDGMARLAGMEPVFEQILNAFDPYFNKNGGDSSGSNSLGSGIQSITEDTAGLLASYINAIRADVSVMRGLQQTGWQNVGAIAGYLQSPSFNDYMARMSANSYDIAQSNSRILAELQSVIRSGSNGGMVVMAELG